MKEQRRHFLSCGASVALQDSPVNDVKTPAVIRVADTYKKRKHENTQ
jgi:hypothetical protein